MKTTATNESMRTRGNRLPLRPRAFLRIGVFAIDAELTTGASAAVALLVFVFVLDLPLTIGLVLAVGVYFAMALILPPWRSDCVVVDGLTDDEFEQFLAAAHRVIGEIESSSEGAETPAVRDRGRAIARIATRILDACIERPQVTTDVRFPFDTLLSAALTALERHRRFAQAAGPAVRRGLSALEAQVFPRIGLGLQQLEERLLNDDMRALRVDLAVLEDLLSLEGLAAQDNDPGECAVPGATKSLEPTQRKETQ